MLLITCTKCRDTKGVDSFYRAHTGRHERMSWCKLCDSARRKVYNAENKDKVRAQVQAWEDRNPGKVAERVRRFRRRHPDRVAATGKAYREQNGAKRAFWQMTRQARQKQAVPLWADLDAIEAIYAACPPGHHVDHIIPLKAMRGRTHVASGLHCEDNLQYLPADENRRKWATLPEDAAAA